MVIMDPKSLRERDLFIDLESGTCATITEEEGTRDTVPRVGQAKKMLNSVWSGFVSNDGSIRGEEAVNSGNDLSNSVECPVENGETLVEKMFGEEKKVSIPEKKMGPKKPKKKKPPKPPRPPKAPSLDAADQKLVREISELAMLKRARVERMKALKKMKNAKSASSSSNLCALLITILFCLVIIWQGLFSKSSSNLRFQGSPESSISARGGFISIQTYKNFSSGPHGSNSASANMVDQVPEKDGHGEVNRDAG